MSTTNGGPKNRLAGVAAILCIVAAASYWCLPNKVSVKTSEVNLPVARAEALNMAMANLIQSRGRVEAEEVWNQAKGHQERYELLSPFLAFSPSEFVDYMPNGYSIELWATLETLRKARLWRELSSDAEEEIVY